MSLLPRIMSRAWIIALIGTGVFLLWINSVRMKRVDNMSGLTAPELVANGRSPTGYAGGLRRLIVPEHNNESYQWIAQTQQMLARGQWRVRHIAYDNAPAGREVLSPSPYRWWLAVVTTFDRLVAGHNAGQAVERAAVYADPLLHLLLLIGTTIFIAREFGALPASLVAVAVAALFPLGGTFLPGQPNDGTLSVICATWSVLPLLAGIGGRTIATADAADPAQAQTRLTRWFITAGIAGGLGLWVGVARQVPILGGIAIGAALALWLARRQPRQSLSAAWRSWGLAGAITSALAYLTEYAPDHLAGLRLDHVHPLYSLAWLGLGELLARAGERTPADRPARNLRSVGLALLAVLVVTSVPVLLLTKGADAFVADKVAATRLTNLTGSPTAPDFWSWIVRGGFNLTVIATLLPASLLLPTGWLLLRRQTDATQRALLALALGPVIVALAVASVELRWWNLVDGTLLALLLALTVVVQAQFKSTAARAIYFGGFAAALVPGLLLFFRPVSAAAREAVNETDVVALIERDLAGWLANRAPSGNAVVLAPPNMTVSFYFHGGLAGLGTPYWENKEGFMASIRIAGATSPDEAHAVAQGRQLKYIVIPSWDNFLDEYARMGSNQPDHSLSAMLQRWLPPRWLRPIAYRLPNVAGFEGQSVAVFEVVEVQDNAAALSHLTEYFVEMEMTAQAYAAGQTLGRMFPGDLSVAAARAHAQRAAGDSAGFNTTLAEIQTLIANGDDQLLPWERRVSVAIVLAEGKRYDAAKGLVKHCLDEIDEERLRSLGTVPLYRLQVMSKAFGFKIADPRLQALALKLLPAQMRSGL